MSNFGSATSGADLSGRKAAERPTWYYVLIVVAIALVTENANFEFTLVGVGLKNIAAEFHTTHVALVMTVVFVASLVFLPICGKLADIYGKKKILVAAATLFAIGSVICALAPFFWLFLVGRVLQSSFVVAYVAGYGLIRDLFPARLVPIGVGALGVGTGVSAFGGPLLGGFLVDNYGFRSSFWFVFCYDIVVATIVLIAVPETRVRVRQRIDVVGGLLLGCGMAMLVFGVVDTQALPYALPTCVVLLALFVFVERRRSEPLVDLDLLAKPRVWLTLLAAGMGIFVSTANSSVLAPQMFRTPSIPGVFEHGLGLSALQYGLYWGLAFGGVGAISGFVAGWVSRRFAPRTTLLVAVLASTVGVILVLTGQATGYAAVAVVAAFMGVGLGFLYAGANNLIIEAVPAASQGVTTSLLYTALGVMNTLCSAIAGAVTSSYAVPAGGGTTVTSHTGYQVAYLVLLGVSIVAIVLTLVMRHGRAPASGGAVADHREAATQRA